MFRDTKRNTDLRVPAKGEWRTPFPTYLTMQNIVSKNEVYLLYSSLSSMKSLLADSRRGGHRADLSGPVEGRKSSSGRSSQEAEQVKLARPKSMPPF